MRAGIGMVGAASLLLGLLALPQKAGAWGVEGHQVVAALAWDYLTPASRHALDAILASDHDTTTRPDLMSRAVWADVWRRTHPETGEWHFVDIEIDHPDLPSACHGFPASSVPASAGPAQDCVIDRLDAFAHELADPATSPDERALALKYVVHFVADMHQPLHAADHHDKGGNCVRLALGGPRTVNLHSYWDTVAVSEVDPDAQHLATRLFHEITVDQKQEWEQGDPTAWVQQSFELARADAYSIGSPPGCRQDAAPMALPPGYDAMARGVVTEQLKKAGVRLALLLNRALDPSTVPVAH
ncbi:S1/P1 nuclease [Gluconacetobacter takamatsuzukensis]|uniref:S1/P1 Nuclease n=1 Tax=Gluconacetobacter takamatsuzukensis TaxID=1286190 RepID=A0A7W4PRT8_9PROT|nr:S1/P1 nuclease [Gluconacetobacter takamatsuzukensis]MBB2204251.1 S1/P1 Nuclease [Gluconacetobacter takamatsuzukensis]